MNIVQALKQKSRLAGKINAEKNLFQKNNRKHSESKVNLDLAKLLESILKGQEELVELKTRIAVASAPISNLLTKIAEDKSLLTFFNSLNCEEGPQDVGLAHSNVVVRNYVSHLKETERLARINQLQTEINDLQDQIDTYNATTQI